LGLVEGRQVDLLLLADVGLGGELGGRDRLGLALLLDGLVVVEGRGLAVLVDDLVLVVVLLLLELPRLVLLQPLRPDDLRELLVLLVLSDELRLLPHKRVFYARSRQILNSPLFLRLVTLLFLG